MRLRWYWIAAGFIPLLLAFWILGTLWQAQRAAAGAARQLAQNSQAGFSVRTLDSVRNGAELLRTGDVFHDAAEFQGKLYLAGPGGLAEYDSGGSLGRRFRPGIDLPAAPVTALAAGVLTGSGGPELLIATAGEGLIAFDGARFRQIKPDDVPCRNLTALLPTSGGRLLLGTEARGVLVFDGKRLRPFHPSLDNLHITALAGSESDFWAGTLNQGLIHWHAGQVDRFTTAEGLPDPQILTLRSTGGITLAGTPMGIAVFRAGRFDRVLARGIFAAALFRNNEDVTVGTFDEGIVRTAMDPGRVRPASFRGKAATPPQSIRKLFDLNGTPVALTENGLLNLDTGTMLIAPERNALTNSNISAVSRDRAGRLWVGYFDRGLDVLDDGRLQHYEDDAIFCVNRIVRDPVTQATAVATANGLVMFDGAGRRRETHTSARGFLIADHVTDVLIQDGHTVIATPAGLTFIDSAGTHSVSAFHGLINTHVYALAQSGDTVLAGTLGGLSILRNAAVETSYTTANSALRHNWITAIARVGQDWFIGTYGASIVRLTAAGAWESFSDLPPSAIVNFNAILATPLRVYAGTLGAGLLVYERGAGRWRTCNAGLPSLNVTALAADDGSLYIGTDDGLVRIPEEAIR